MSRIEQAIQSAQGELNAAHALPDSDDSKAMKVAAAQAKVAALQEQKRAIEDEINDAVRTRVPGAETSGKEAERKAIAAALGIPSDQLTDETLADLKKLREGQQSELEREQTARQSAEQRATNLERSESKAKQTAESARTHLENTLKRQAVERALLAEGVIHETGEGKHSYLDVTAEQALRLGEVSVEVEVDEDGHLSVKGEVAGADEAAKKAKGSYPAMFAEAPGRSVRPNPPADRGRDSSKRAYRPNYSRPGG